MNPFLEGCRVSFPHHATRHPSIMRPGGFLALACMLPCSISFHMQPSKSCRAPLLRAQSTIVAQEVPDEDSIIRFSTDDEVLAVSYQQRVAELEAEREAGMTVGERIVAKASKEQILGFTVACIVEATQTLAFFVRSSEH